MDLWALGCMIYEMRVGLTPFNGQVDFEVFNKIKERQLVIPNELEPECVDVIDKLLQLDPRSRLGMGPKGSDFDFAALKSHPFFSAINFETLQQTSPPIPAERFVKYFSDYKAKAERKSADSLFFSQRSIGNVDVNQPVPSPLLSDSPTKNEQAPPMLGSILNLSSVSRVSREEFKFQGVVMKHPKRKKTFAKPRCRNMILTNEHRLYFTSTEAVDGKEGMYLSDIMLFSDLKVTVKNEDMLTIHCPTSQLTYLLRTCDAKQWQEHINAAILSKDFGENNLLFP